MQPSDVQLDGGDYAKMAEVEKFKKAALPKLTYLPNEEADDPKDRRLSRTSFRKKDRQLEITGGIADKMREADYEGKARERAGYS